VKKIKLLEIMDLKFLQNLQDFFAMTMNVASLVVDNEGPVTEPSNFTDFCSKCMRSNEMGRKRCNQCDIEWGKVAAEKFSPTVYTCHAGLKDFVVPIIVEGKHIASILGGQILTEPPNEEEFRQLARELNINEEKCLEEVRKIRIVSPKTIEVAVDFLYNVANAISALLYANIKLAKFGIDYKLNRTFEIEDWFLSHCPKLANPITAREFEVLKLVVLGKNNGEIAKELFISVHTVKAHVSSILEKFSVEDRVQIAVKAVREGLV